MKGKSNPLVELIEAYESYLISSSEALWKSVKIEADKLEAYSVMGALLSRQVTLSIELARSPKTWNGHSAPLFLRAMTDLYIALAWILGEPVERSKKYIMHGLGEEKLVMEHYKQMLRDSPDDPDREQIEQLIDIKDKWINSQRRDFFVEVNLGHWAQLDYRKMAQEADCEDLYKFAYKPFSQAAHNMWPHVSVYNSRYCENPLHKHHLIPERLDFPIDVDYLYRSCKYVDKVYQLFIDKLGVALELPMPHEWWDQYFTDTPQPADSSGTDQQ
jgi:Family of unknown function (DUF5677)